MEVEECGEFERRRSRKSNRPKKRKKAYSPEPQLDSKRKPKTIPKTQLNRPYDILPNGEPFSCTLCKSPYVVNTKGHKTVRSRHTPLPKIRIDQNSGREIQLCNACAQSFDRPRHRTKKPEIFPSEDEQQSYLNEAKLLTKEIKAKLDVPYVDKLYCPVSKKKLCGCLQRYIKTEMSLSGITCVQTFVDLMTEAEELRKEKVYSAVDVKTKANKKSIGLGNGHKKSKKYEEFVITKRRILKEDMRLCERATQRILMYSNNFLHKKLKTEERPCRIERTRGKAALGKLPEIHTLVDMVCCSENCVMMALTHRKLLQSWRERSKLGQLETRRVLAEMLTPAGANHRNCYHFIGYVTGCSLSTIGRVYNMMMETSGTREPPEHGMKRVWQENYKQNKPVGHDREKTGNDETATTVPTKLPGLPDSGLLQKQRKPPNQRLTTASTESNMQMQYELQKQQLARIQMDLIEKQQQLEQQQANLQLQLLAQQSNPQPDHTQNNQVVLQQILHQIVQQQQQQQLQYTQTTVPDQGKVLTSQTEVPVNQSVQTGSNVSQTASLHKQSPVQMLNVNYINGEIHLSVSGVNQSTEQCEVITPATFTMADTGDRHGPTDNHVVLEGNVDNTNQVVVNQLGVQKNQFVAQSVDLNTGGVRQIHIPDGYIVPNSGTFVNANAMDIGLAVTGSEMNVTDSTGNQCASLPCNTGTGMQITMDQSKPGAFIYTGSTPVDLCNYSEQGTFQAGQNGSSNPRLEIQFVPSIGGNTNSETSQTLTNQHVAGQTRLTGIPVQVLDQQFQLIPIEVPDEESDGSASQPPGTTSMTISQEKTSANSNFGQTQLLYNVLGGGTLTQTSMAQTNIIDQSQNSSQPVQNIQLVVNSGESDLHTERQADGVPLHPTHVRDSTQIGGAPDGLVNVYGTTSSNETISQSNNKTLDKTHNVLDKGHHPKRNVQFKNVEELPVSADSHLILKDVTVSHEDSLVNPDMVLPRPNPRSRSRQSSGNSVRSRQSSGNPSKSRHSSGNSLLNIESFKQLNNSFKLKDLGKTSNMVSGNRSRMSSGDRSRQSSGDRSRQHSGDRSRQHSGDRSRQHSGDRSRQLSGNSIFGEFSNVSNISPNLFFTKDKNVFFLQAIDSIGALEDIQSPDYAMFNSSPTNAVNAPITEISLTEAGRVEFDSNFITASLLSHDNSQCETDGIGQIREQSHYDNINQVPPVTIVTSEPSSQKALKNPVLNSILSRPPKNLSD